MRERQEENGMKKFFEEFKAFISKGNVLDMAVGVIIGAAFKSIVDSLVADIISPLLGLLAQSGCDEGGSEAGSNGGCYGRAELWQFPFFCHQFPDYGIDPVLHRKDVQQSSDESGQSERKEKGRARKAGNKDLSVLQERDRGRGDQMPALHVGACEVTLP